MAHCLWTAYCDHIEYLDLHILPGEVETYCEFKTIGQKQVNNPTWGGIVPWVIWGLAKRNGVQIKAQHDIWTPEHYLADATPIQAKIINFSDFGSLGITLAPAIYCDLDTQHALFAEEIPDGNIVLAIQLSRKGG